MNLKKMGAVDYYEENIMLKKILPDKIYEILNEKVNFKFINEIRVRAGKPIVLSIGGHRVFLGEKGTTGNIKDAIFASKIMIEDIIFRASECSLYSVNEQIKRGFIVTAGGLRLGLGGDLIEENDKIKTKHSRLIEENENLKNKYVNMKIENENLKTKYSSIKEENKNLKTKCSTLREEHADIKSSYDNVTSKYDQLKQENLNTKTSYAEMYEVNESLEKDYDDLRLDYNDLVDKYNDLEEELYKLKINRTRDEYIASKVKEFMLNKEI